MNLYPKQNLQINRFDSLLKTTPAQYDIYLKYLRNFRILKTGETKPTMKSEEFWNNLTDEINNCGEGPRRSCEGWKKTFADWKYNVRRRVREGNTLSAIEAELLKVTGLGIASTLAPTPVQGVELIVDKNVQLQQVPIVTKIRLDICVLCLMSNKKKQNILSSDKDGIIVKEKLKFIFSELINFTPEIPKNICVGCLEHLNHVYRYKQKYSKNLIYLNNYMQDITAKNNGLNHLARNFTETQLPPENHKTDVSTKTVEAQEIDVKEEVEIKEEQEDFHDDTDVQCRTLLFDEINTENLEELVKSESIEDDVMREEANVTDNVEEFDIEEAISKKVSINIHDENDITCDPLLLERTEMNLEDYVQNTTTNNADRTSTTTVVNTEDIRVLYKCGRCQKIYTQSYLLKTHNCSGRAKKRHKQINIGEPPYKCNECGQVFTFKNNYTMHQRSHIVEKKYKCNFCEAVFVSADHLIDHKRKHVGQKHKCIACGRLFNNITSFARHKCPRRPRASVKYRCDVCNLIFNSINLLKTHKQSHT